MGNCPDFEQIGSVVDGMADSALRHRVLAHVAECDLCYELYTTTLQYVEDTRDLAAALGESTDPSAGDGSKGLNVKVHSPGESGRSRGRHSWATRYWLPLAAAIAILLAPVLLWTLLKDSNRVQVQALLAPLEEADLGGVPAWIRIEESSGFGPSVDRQELSFVLGTELVDFAAARQAGNPELAARVLANTRRQLLSVGNAGPALTTLDHALEQVSQSDLQTLEQGLREPLDDRWFELGKLVEAGRLAAQLRKSTFWEEFGRNLADRLEEIPAHPELSGEIQDLKALVDRDFSTASAADWERLMALLDDLKRGFGP